MELQGFRCWETRRVYTVMNPDAEHVADELFLAVHTDYPLTLIDPNLANRGSADAIRFHRSAQELLTEFLNPERNHVQVVVMGGSGSGKSHFIKWLSLNIPQRWDRRVLVIPKAGMSLRRIVERLIEELPAEMQPRYQERLSAIGYDTADRGQLRQQLCNRIAEALQSASFSDEMEEWLVQELPNLFYDPQLRVILNSRQGVIEELVEHIFQGPEGYQRLESQRLFQQEDLPLQPGEMKELSAKTRLLVGQLQADAELVQVALKLINQNLGKAIARSLNFTGDQLLELMLDVRRGLKAEGQSLVLLIEDFARLQGIDGALLQALIEAASPENGLCELRWAMAVTRGYYEQQVPATVQTRMTFVVNMDVPTGNVEGGITAEKVVTFASRYLNATRVSGAELSAWREAQLAGDVEPPLPNHCSDCLLRTTCHQTFGHVDGFGLYPFTANAVLNMTRRKDPNFAERFNPRVLVKDVMQEILGTQAASITTGTFPSKELLDQMGGSKFNTVTVEKLRAENPEQADRRLALASLWGKRPDFWEALPPALYESFHLTPPALIEPTQPDEKAKGKEGGVGDLGPTKLSPADLIVAAVHEWGRGGILQDGPTNALRGLLKDGLDAYLEWDQIGISSSSVEFERRHIGLHGQLTTYRPAAGALSLHIPFDPKSEDERRHTALALEGLVRFSEHRSWQFPNGTLLMAAYAEAMERWAAHLIKQVQDPPGGATWDPVSAAVELLTINNAMTDLPLLKDASTADWLDSLFHQGRAPHELMASTWRTLATDLNTRRAALQEVVRARSSGTKGGRVGAFIDPTRILEALRRIKRTWKPAEQVPVVELERRSGGLKGLGLARKRIEKDLDLAVQQEAERRRDLVTVVAAALPDGYSWKGFVTDLKDLTDQVSNLGVSRSNLLQTSLKELLIPAEKLAVEDALKEVLGLDEKSRTNLSYLGRTKTSQILHHASGVVKAATRYLDDLEAGIAKDHAALGEEGDLLDRSKERIAQGLASLTSTLNELGGEGDA